MKIMCCPHCQKAVVTNILYENMQEIITCVHCGFSDYAYIFKLSPKRKSTHKTFNDFSVADVIQTIRQQMEYVDLSNINIEQFIYDLHGRCAEFSPLMICKLINTLLEYSEVDQNDTGNETLFVKYEQENITLDDIYQKLDDLQNSVLMRLSIDSASVDIQELERKLLLKQHEIETWEKEYNQLSDKYQIVMEENKTLKSLLQKSN